MRIVVNGEERQAEDCASLASVIEQLGLRPERVAVELNGEVVRRADWPNRILADGDRLEVVHFVGGGENYGFR